MTPRSWMRPLPVYRNAASAASAPPANCRVLTPSHVQQRAGAEHDGRVQPGGVAVDRHPRRRDRRVQRGRRHRAPVARHALHQTAPRDRVDRRGAHDDQPLRAPPTGPDDARALPGRSLLRSQLRRPRLRFGLRAANAACCAAANAACCSAADAACCLLLRPAAVPPRLRPAADQPGRQPCCAARAAASAALLLLRLR